MEALKIVFSLISNLLNLYCNVRAVKLFLTPKKEPKVSPKSVYTAIWLVNWIVYYTFNLPILNLTSMFIGLFIVNNLLFDGKPFRKITAIAASLTLSFISEDITWRLYCIPDFLPRSLDFTGILIYLLSLIILLILEYLLNLHKDIALPKSIYLHTISLLLCSAILCELILFLGNDNSFAAILSLCIILLINITTLFQYDKLNEVYKRTLEQKNMEQRLTMYDNQFEVIKESQKNLRSLRHDMNNHLALLDNYIQKKDFENASAYLYQIEANLTTPKEFCHTKNTEIDSILNYLLNQAEQLHCEISTKIDVPRQRFMPDFDLNILLSNLLENALEALTKVDKRILKIYIRYGKKILYISVYNSFDGNTKQKNGLFQTLKPDKELHGYGLMNMQKIIEKYNGKSIFRTDGNMFKADIILYTDSQK